MTARERDSVARLLREVAARLRGAPKEAEDKAKDAAPRDQRYAYESGMLGATCRIEAEAIERYVAEYLQPPKTRASAA